MSALVARTAVIAGYLIALAVTTPVDALALLLASALVAVWAMPALRRATRSRRRVRSSAVPNSAASKWPKPTRTI